MSKLEIYCYGISCRNGHDLHHAVCCALCAKERITQLEAAVKVLREANMFYEDDSINHHNYHSLMNTDLAKRAREAEEKAKEILGES